MSKVEITRNEFYKQYMKYAKSAEFAEYLYEHMSSDYFCEMLNEFLEDEKEMYSRNGKFYKGFDDEDEEDCDDDEDSE